jgi:hypothetical protein
MPIQISHCKTLSKQLNYCNHIQFQPLMISEPDMNVGKPKIRWTLV